MEKQIKTVSQAENETLSGCELKNAANIFFFYFLHINIVGDMLVQTL